MFQRVRSMVKFARARSELFSKESCAGNVISLVLPMMVRFPVMRYSAVLVFSASVMVKVEVGCCATAKKSSLARWVRNRVLFFDSVIWVMSMVNVPCAVSPARVNSPKESATVPVWELPVMRAAE